MIYFITKSSASAGSSRQRGFVMAEFLRKAGFPAEVIPPPEYPADAGLFKKWGLQWRYMRKILSIKKTDTVILQNLIRNPRLIVVLAVLKLARHPHMIFDIDDGSYMRNPWMVNALVALSDKIIVASQRLAEWPGFKKRPIHIMPNLVDSEQAKHYSAKSPSPLPVVGWIGGGPGSLKNLRLLVPIFEKLAAQKIHFRFRLIGALGSGEVRGLFANISGLNVEFVDKLEWGKPGEIQKANASFDIGLCPLVDDEEGRVRCSLKVLDYMAVGTPVVISPVGENTYFVENGVQGFLPKTTDEWVEKLALLIKDFALRQKMGVAAAKHLAEHFSYQTHIARYADFVLRP